MLMEFVDGVDAGAALKDGPLPVHQAVDYISQALSALDYAHQHGVIHRDIKPANMMLTPSGVVKLMDFGIAKASTDQRLTMTGTTMGSLYYMSPEQIQGAANIDSRADLYSVGVSLYELVTGKRPFDGDSQFAIMSAHLEKTPVPPVEIDPRLPQGLNDAILMSVAKDPAARFQTAERSAPHWKASCRRSRRAEFSKLPPLAGDYAAAPNRAGGPETQRQTWIVDGRGRSRGRAGCDWGNPIGPWKDTKAQSPSSQAQAPLGFLRKPRRHSLSWSGANVASTPPQPLRQELQSRPSPRQNRWVSKPHRKALPPRSLLRRLKTPPVTQPVVQPPPVQQPTVQQAPSPSSLKLPRLAAGDDGVARAACTTGCARQRHSYESAIAATVAGGSAASI